MDDHNHNHSHKHKKNHQNSQSHDHKHGSESHIFEYRRVEKRKLIFSLIITAIVMVVELVGGFITNSIALISDAGHMFTHCFAIGISIGAIYIAQRPPCHHITFGLYRAEVLAAFINGLFLLVIVVVIIYEAVIRIFQPVEVFGFEMMLIGIIGLCVNITTIMILRGTYKKDLNVKSVFYHMFADAAASVGVVAAAGVIYYTNYYLLDPLVSIGISIIIIFWSWQILRESSRILLEIAPKGYNSETIANDLKKKFPKIKEIYGSHIWAITMDMYIYYAHINLNPDTENGKIVHKINEYLSEKYNIIESTIQIDTDESPHVCYFK